LLYARGHAPRKDIGMNLIKDMCHFSKDISQKGMSSEFYCCMQVPVEWRYQRMGMDPRGWSLVVDALLNKCGQL